MGCGLGRSERRRRTTLTTWSFRVTRLTPEERVRCIKAHATLYVRGLSEGAKLFSGAAPTISATLRTSAGGGSFEIDPKQFLPRFRMIQVRSKDDSAGLS